VGPFAASQASSALADAPFFRAARYHWYSEVVAFLAPVLVTSFAPVAHVIPVIFPVRGVAMTTM
jgi:hypothetical protein